MKCRFQLLILDHKLSFELFLLSPFSASLNLSFFILLPSSLFLFSLSLISSVSPFPKNNVIFSSSSSLSFRSIQLFLFFFQLFFSFSVFLGHRNFNGKASSVNKTHPSCYQMSLSLREKNPFNKKSNTFCKNRIQANIWLEPGATQHDFFRWIQLFTNFDAW